MAKEQKTKSETEAASPDKWVRVRIRRAIGLGGLSLRPRIDGGNIVPVEAVITAAQAALHGPAYVEVLDADAPAPAGGRPGLVGDQDVTPANTQFAAGVVK